MTLVLDAGALVALERGDADLTAWIKDEWRSGRAPRTHGGVLGQVWRGGHGRQSNLARFLKGIHVSALDEELGKQSGALLSLTGTKDVLDAAIVLLAGPNDHLVTSDPTDLQVLAEAAGVSVGLVTV